MSTTFNLFPANSLKLAAFLLTNMICFTALIYIGIMLCVSVL